ncbi:MAG: hypothetical protein GTO63_07700 [Anaerolineae bacterium]|nr:hypothetical protein [Anaerolineae bacterium]NIN94788.1 hypothetical protein [Anaerolineae bacterium]NIQ77870.1 hypothetical protein [Anaerolineae bacterium]
MAGSERVHIVLMDIPERLPSPDVVRLLRPEVAEELRAVPLAVEDGALTAVIASPRDHAAIDVLAEMTGYDVFPVLSPPHQWEAALERFRALCSEESPKQDAE